MRTALLTVDVSGTVSPASISIGHEGEHNITALTFSLAPELISAVGFYRIALGNYLSEALYPENDRITYLLPQSVMLQGSLFIQLEGYTKNDVGELVLVFKSDVITAEVKRSIEPFHEISDEVKTGISGAMAELSYYVESSAELSENIASMLEETKEVIADNNRALENKTADYKQDMSALLNEGREVLQETKDTLSNKADKATTLEAYGIEDAWTKKQSYNRSQVDDMFEHAHSSINKKANLPRKEIIPYESYYLSLYENDAAPLSSHYYFDSDSRTNMSFKYYGKLVAGGKYRLTIDTLYASYQPSYGPSVDAITEMHIASEVEGLYLTYIKDCLFDVITDGVDNMNCVCEFTLPESFPELDYVYFSIPTSSEDLKSQTTMPVILEQFIDGEFITLTDNTVYASGENKVNSLNIKYPEGDFIASLTFTLASEGDITITLPESKYIGGAPNFANGETWELNIKNGVVVGGLIE